MMADRGRWVGRHRRTSAGDRIRGAPASQRRCAPERAAWRHMIGEGLSHFEIRAQPIVLKRAR
jgi:hypothetical protein